MVDVGSIRIPRRGDVFWVDFTPARGSEQDGVRPAVVISTDAANHVLSVVTIAAITRSVRRASPLQLVLPAGRPCRDESAILGFQVLTVARDRLRRRIGSLDEDQRSEMAQLLRRVWDL